MARATPLFTSSRERRRLWICALAVVAAIYSTLGLAGTLAGALRERSLLEGAVLLLMLATVATIVGSGMRGRPSRREVWVALGLTAAYGMAVVRMGGSPEERTHLFEYGIVAVLIRQAFAERAQNGRRGGCRGWPAPRSRTGVRRSRAEVVPDIPGPEQDNLLGVAGLDDGLDHLPDDGIADRSHGRPDCSDGVR